ncbi:MAG TPA: HAMP domain-containing sensor histidine kinase [Gaiellaceae bacterium]|nr:HAMP domain-containing sensor histidine kinase [Gaiellaceae bacterium]
MRRPLLSLSVKAGLILFAVVAGALAIVYAAVAPRLESRLVDAKIEELERALPAVAGTLNAARSWLSYPERVDALAQTFDARVVVFSKTGDTLLVIADSGVPSDEDLRLDPIALEAAGTDGRVAGRTSRGDREFAQVAEPLGDDEVVLLSAPLEDTLANVGIVARSLALAGGVALLVSWFAGYLVAWTFTRRIRRLERAAERLAEGDFETPVVDEGRDEVGQLARAFDSTRARLAVLDRARREFIANASHELRTPLFSLGGFVELLQDEDVEPDVRADFLREMRGQIDRLTRLATDLLDLSRLDAGQLEVEVRPFDLAASARTVADEFRAVADAEGHTLLLEATAPVEALADEVRVQQIARALVENAIRHTPAGTVVAISVGRRDGRSALVVRDDGPGIPVADQAQLFQRFYRAAGGKAFGSGLGLAIASELAARMDGTIDLRSELGETVFTLTLPSAAPDSFPRGSAISEHQPSLS